MVLAHPDLIPPSSPRGHNLEAAPWRCEYDVIRVLRKMGHEVEVVGVLDDANVIRETAERWKPHIAFNLMEEFRGEAQFDLNVVAYLEMLGIPYTGCNPRGLMLCRQKGLAKMLLAYNGIPTPRFEIFRRNLPIRRPAGLEFPLFVKSLTEEASLGIAQTSIVRSDRALEERVKFIHEQVGSDAMVESFVEGRELYVAMLGNRKPLVLPVWELKFLKAPEDLPRIATPKVKFDPAYRKRYGITSGPARSLPPETEERIKRICLDTYRLLDLNGYVRMDLRMNAAGEVYILEANPNPHIGKEEDFAYAALRVGIKYPDLLHRILQYGLRWNPAT